MRLGDLVYELAHIANKTRVPEDGAAVIKTEINLLRKRPNMFSLDHNGGYRVRKIEWVSDSQYWKYGLSWKTGEWILITDGYPDETFLEVPDAND